MDAAYIKNTVSTSRRQVLRPLDKHDEAEQIVVLWIQRNDSQALCAPDRAVRGRRLRGSGRVSVGGRYGARCNAGAISGLQVAFVAGFPSSRSAWTSSRLAPRRALPRSVRPRDPMHRRGRAPLG